MGTGKVDADRVVAWLVVIGAHALFWWLLTRDAANDAEGDDDDALQLAWIEPPPPPPIPTIRKPSPQPPTPGPDRRPPPGAPVDTATQQATTPASHVPLSAVFIEQARRMPAAGDEADAFRRDVLAHRAARLPGVQADTFRMRPPPSIRGVLLKIGAMAGGSGYTTDPCPRIADNINALSQGGDSPLLQEELRRKRRLCD